MPRGDVLFRETQRIHAAWPVWIIAIPILPIQIFLLTALLRGYRVPTPVPGNYASRGDLLAVLTITVAVELLLLWLFRTTELTTEVRPDGLWVRFAPFHRIPRHIDGIVEARAREYRPIAEYGGWGIRLGGVRSMAYNISGNRGVQLRLANGRKLLIGSQRADELERAIAAVTAV